MENNPFGYLIVILSIIWISVYCSIPNENPTNKEIYNHQPPIGYNFGKVGKDSVLVIKGTFVRQVGDRVIVKIK